MTKTGLLLGLSILTAGCALTSKSTPRELRYFSPESSVSTSTVTPPALEDAPRLRLGRIGASGNLRSRIVYRTSAVELGEYEELRWSDAPEVYARRALARAFFAGTPRARPARGGPAPAVDVELVAFEEVVRPGARAGAVELTYSVVDGTDVIAQGRTRKECPAATTTIESVVAAIAAALDEATEEVARATLAALERRSGVRTTPREPR